MLFYRLCNTTAVSVTTSPYLFFVRDWKVTKAQ